MCEECADLVEDERIEQARAEEREACAQIVRDGIDDAEEPYGYCMAKWILGRIRARGEGGK